MLASDDPEAVKHKLLDLMKQAKEQWECVLQLHGHLKGDRRPRQDARLAKEEGRDREEPRRSPE